MRWALGKGKRERLDHPLQPPPNHHHHLLLLCCRKNESGGYFVLQSTHVMIVVVVGSRRKKRDNRVQPLFTISLVENFISIYGAYFKADIIMSFKSLWWLL